MDGGLLSLLESKGLTFLTDTLSRLGVARVSDFRYLSEQDLEDEGIKKVQCRQLLALAAEGGAGGGEDTGSPWPAQDPSAGGSQGGAPAPATPGAVGAGAQSCPSRCEGAQAAAGADGSRRRCWAQWDRRRQNYRVRCMQGSEHFEVRVTLAMARCDQAEAARVATALKGRFLETGATKEALTAYCRDLLAASPGCSKAAASSAKPCPGPAAARPGQKRSRRAPGSAGSGAAGEAPGGRFSRRCGLRWSSKTTRAARLSRQPPRKERAAAVPTTCASILKAIVVAARASPGKSRPPSWAHAGVTEAEVPERPKHWPKLARPDLKSHTSWLPRDWDFGHKLTRGGKLLPCYVRQGDGRMRFHKADVEGDVGRQLTSEERGLKSHARWASGEFGDPETTVLKRTVKSVGNPAAYIDDRCKLLDGLTIKAALTEFKYDRTGKLVNYTNADLRYDLKSGRITTELAAAPTPSASESGSASQGGC